MVYLFYSIKYIIDGNILHIKTGLFISGKINIQDIKSVTKTYNPLSAPALSINRLEIKYGNNYDYALISPKNREEFVQQLLSVNPAIKVKL
ncbi:hypothetical protein CHU92_01805 [Flavobacterium cyanobacteriorum]|uniref:Uncharacterized protein YyaB-like PH domain-containing protein n=1 Tax=Flavobacterium cyanobacteriorum TaxID=2022802 RepID=A0A255ZYS2_9FLAO|nr:PH domain-containing protein [Flavobacterium cyanobacteriorum]OYQ45940.1 hypothetical protein CHU92_01805 [Flavobacterium cyanobacteriorum]